MYAASEGLRRLTFLRFRFPVQLLLLYERQDKPPLFFYDLMDRHQHRRRREDD